MWHRADLVSWGLGALGIKFLNQILLIVNKIKSPKTKNSGSHINGAI